MERHPSHSSRGQEPAWGAKAHRPARRVVVEERGPVHLWPLARARRGTNVSVAGHERLPEHLGGDDRQPSPPGPCEILVRMRACGLSHADHALSTGATSRLSARGAPYACGIGAAGTVIAAGGRAARFDVGDEVFGRLVAEFGAWGQVPCARTTADGPHVERRPEGLDPLSAAALAESGLTATTILRAAEPRPGQTALVLGATSGTGTVLVPLLAEAGAHVIAGAAPEDEDHVRALGAADTIWCTTADPLGEALGSHPDVDLLVDLVTFGDPYFITAAARQGTIVSALPAADRPGVPRIGISAEPGDLAGLARRALDRRRAVELARV